MGVNSQHNEIVEESRVESFVEPPSVMIEESAVERVIRVSSWVVCRTIWLIKPSDQSIEWYVETSDEIVEESPVKSPVYFFLYHSTKWQWHN
jgi:hypothetical protein